MLRPGGSREIEVSVAARVLPAAPGALEGVVGAVVGPGARRAPWSAAVPVTRRPVVTGVALSRQAFRPSDTRPAVLAFVAGRIDGSAERPQILPLTELELQLYRGRRRSARSCAFGTCFRAGTPSGSPDAVPTAGDFPAARTRCRWWGRPSGRACDQCPGPLPLALGVG